MKKYRQVITIATGNSLYVDLAVNLARSFFHWHANSDIKFQLITDLPSAIPADVNTKAQVIAITPGELGVGFSVKLNLDKLINDGQTLFIDSDCLIFEDLEPLFDRFKGHSVSVAGSYIATGEWFGNVGRICRQHKIPHLPKFNGGLYYIEKCLQATAVFETARTFEKCYDDIGFVRLRGRPNDEVLIALAMQLHGETAVTDDGTIMSDPQACPGGYQINVLKGKRWLLNPRLGKKGHQSWYPFEKVSPAIVHFLGNYTDHYPYRKEAYLLSMFAQRREGFWVNTRAIMLIQLPQQTITLVKNVFRPVYHMLFGFRKVKKSNRLL